MVTVHEQQIDPKSPRRIKRVAAAVSLVCFAFNALGVPALAQAEERHDRETASPIKHLIVVIGENRTFDHLFATYVPKAGQSVDNLLSKGIVNADGTPGPNYTRARQYSAVDQAPQTYSNSPGGKSVYNPMPPLAAGGPTNPYVSAATLPLVQASVEPNLSPDYYQYLITGGTGQTAGTMDTRLPNNNNLPAGPYQLSSASLPYDSYTASPVHRFYQMWQQLDCSRESSHEKNPSGCRHDLFPWVEVTTRPRHPLTISPRAKARLPWASTTSRPATCRT
jgi:phospholipase C